MLTVNICTQIHFLSTMKALRKLVMYENVSSKIALPIYTSLERPHLHNDKQIINDLERC